MINDMKNYRILGKTSLHNHKLWIDKYEKGEYRFWTKEEYEEAKCNLEFMEFLNQITIEDCQEKGLKFERICKVVKYLTR